MDKKIESLNPKQERFCLEYLFDGNAERAMVRAGYPKGSIKNGNRLLQQPAIKAYLREQRSALRKSTR